MLVLSIESSCDETSIAFLEGNDLANDNFYGQINEFKVLSSVISSQIDIHAEFGGVIPEIGARSHAEQIHTLFLKTVKDAQKKDFSNNLDDQDIEFLSTLEHIFVTTSPGLASALKVGSEFAKTIQSFIQLHTSNTPNLINTNHLKGHVASCFYQQDNKNLTNQDIFPHLHLLVSGGNSQLILIKNPQEWEIVGKTLDDAAGESFDKIGRMLGFPYPGGVYLARTAGMDEENYMNFPVGMKNPQYNLSYSGLKTAVRYYLERQDHEGFIFEEKLSKDEVNKLLSNTLDTPKLELAYKTSVSSQKVIIEQLLKKVKLVLKNHDVKSIGLSGGVSANKLLRSKISKLPVDNIFIAPIELTGDNAIMIALAGVWNNVFLTKH